jgi:hypothetical protein
MSCPSGFDPFGERGADFLEHASACVECQEVLRVLSACRDVWKTDVARDDVRAVFRERRLGYARRAARPLRVAVSSAAFFIAIGVASAWAFERFVQPLRETPPTRAAIAVSMNPRVVPRTDSPTPTDAPVVPPPAPTVDLAPPKEESSSLVPTAVVLPGPPARLVVRPSDLWDEGLKRLDHGDRDGARRLFRRVIDAPDAETSLRMRAMFRWSQVLLAMGDTATPRDTLWQLVRGPDTALGFDAALLLERCVPDERQHIWDTFLDRAPSEPLRSQAIERRDKP